MRRTVVLPRALKAAFCGALTSLLVVFSSPAVSVAVVTDQVALAGLSSFEIRRSKIDDVLDSYGYFYCYQNSSHNVRLLDPTYRTITYRNGYTRKNPDTPLYSIAKYPCPSDSTHNGLMKRFSCSYETY